MSVTALSKVDGAVGEVIRLHRKAKGLTQRELGEAANVSFQQVQKYEAGQNRLSIARLFQFAAALDISPTQFVSELEKRVEPAEFEQNPHQATLEFLATKQGQRLVRATMSMTDPDIVDAVVDLLSAAGQRKDA